MMPAVTCWPLIGATQFNQQFLYALVSARGLRRNVKRQAHIGCHTLPRMNNRHALCWVISRALGTYGKKISWVFRTVSWNRFCCPCRLRVIFEERTYTACPRVLYLVHYG